MNGLLDLIAAAKKSGNLASLIDAVPYAHFLGISAESRDGQLVSKMSFSEMLVGNPALPALHGGTLGGLMESTAVFQILWEAETQMIPKIINITLEYLRSGGPRDTFAQGIITRQGRRVGNVRVEAWQSDRQRPIAIAYANFLLG